MGLVAAVAVSSGCSLNAKLGGGGTTPGSSGSSSSGGAQSSASESIEIPQLLWLSEAEARKALARAGHRGTVTVDNGSLCGSTLDGKVVDKQVVCYQHPPAGRTQPAKLQVSIKVQTEDPYHGRLGTHNEWHLMPELVGKTLVQAQATMRNAGFTNEEHIRINRVTQVGCSPNTICKTYPEALQRSGVNSGKVLYVGADLNAKKPPVVTQPDAKHTETATDPDKPTTETSEPTDFF